MSMLAADVLPMRPSEHVKAQSIMPLEIDALRDYIEIYLPDLHHSL